MTKKKLFSFNLILFLLISMVGCSGKSNVSSLSSLSDRKGIVVGKFILKINGKDVTEKGSIFFDGHNAGTPLKKLDPGTHFTLSFDAGNHSITGINYYEGYPTVPIENTRGGMNFGFNVKPNTINYIGTITLNWTIDEMVFKSESSGLDPIAASALGGPLGVGLFSRPKFSEYFGKDVGEVIASVEFDKDEINHYLKNKFNQDVNIVETVLEGAELSHSQIKEKDTVNNFTQNIIEESTNKPLSGQSGEDIFQKNELKLQKIKEMYDKGLITKEEYDQERKEVLDEM